MIKKSLLIITLIVLGKFSFGQSISAGKDYSLYICPNGTVKVWGNNHRSKLGLGSEAASIKLPTTIPNLNNVIAVSAGRTLSLFLKADGTVWHSGNFESSFTENWIVPTQITGLSGITKISSGDNHALFLKNDGTVWAYGFNNDGQLGVGPGTNSEITPVQITSLSNVVDIQASYGISLFIKNDGTVWVCGSNKQLVFESVVGTDVSIYYPTQIPSLSNVVDVSIGLFSCLYLKSDGTVWYTGTFDFTTKAVNPTKINPLNGITAIESGGHSNLFLKNDGTVWALGDNKSSQLGSDNGLSTTPHQIGGLTNISSFSVGKAYFDQNFGFGEFPISVQANHTLFLKNDGTVLSCGDNTYGQIGNGTVVSANSPVIINNICVPPTPPQVNFSNFPTSLCVGSNINIEPEISGSLPDVNFTVDNSINVTAPKNIAKNSHAVFVLDGANHIMRYNLNGSLQYTYNAASTFTGLTAFAPDESDNVWIFNSVNQRLVRLGPGGATDTSSITGFPLWNGLNVTDMTFADVPLIENLMVVDTSGNGDLITSYDVNNSDPFSNNQLSLADSTFTMANHKKITSIAFDNNLYAERRLLSADPQHNILWQRRFTGGNWFNSARPLVDTASTSGLKLDFIDTDTTAKLDSYSTSIITTSSSTKNIIGIVWTNTSPNGESTSYLDTTLLAPIVTQAPVGIVNASSGNMPQFWIADKGLNKLLRVQMVTYRLTPSLPPGLKFSTLSGQVEGSPTTVMAPQTYQLIVNNGLGSDTTYFTFGVTPTLPPSNTPGTASTTGTHNDGLTIKYYDPNNCSKLIEIADSIGGTSPGRSEISQTVYPLVSVIANDSLIRRVNQIRADNQDALTVNIKLYYTYQDIQAFNSSRGSALLSNDTVGGTMQMAVLQMHDRPDGSKEPIIHSPITATWSNTDHYWVATVPVTKFSEFYGSDIGTLNTFDCSNTGADTLSVPNSYYVWNYDTLFANGDYVDTLINQTGCDSITSLHLTLSPIGINEASVGIGYAIFPNPNNGVFTIINSSTVNAARKVKVLNVLGNIVYTCNLNGTNKVDISQYESGIYFIVIETDNKPFITRIIKQ